MSATRASLWVFGGLLLAASAVPAAAADDGYDNVLSSVATAVGLLSKDPPPEIDYRERAPLVLPPKMNLVTPSEAAARPSSWPQDPDVARRRKAAAEGRAPSNAVNNPKATLSKDELMQGRVNAPDTDERPASAIRQAQCGQSGNGKGCLTLNPDQLKAESDYYRDHNPETAKAESAPGIEPDRVYLTQPPKGYLKVNKVVAATNDGPRNNRQKAPSAYDFMLKKDKPDD